MAPNPPHKRRRVEQVTWLPNRWRKVLGCKVGECVANFHPTAGAGCRILRDCNAVEASCGGKAEEKANDEKESGGRMSEVDAEAYIASIPQKVWQCVCNPEVEVQGFAKRVLHDATEALKVVEAGGVDGRDECRLLGQLVSLVCSSPGELDGSFLAGTEGALVVGHERARTGVVKLRARELQICFRMEIVSLFKNVWRQEHGELLDEVCHILDDVQFNLGDGVFDGESLIDYAGKVIRERYDATVPEAVMAVYQQMEFLGYNDESAATEELLNEEGAAWEPDDIEIPIGAWQSGAATLAQSIDQSIRLSGRRRVCGCRKEIFKDPVAVAATGSKTVLEKTQDIAIKRQRARRLSHFTSRAVEMLKQVAIDPPCHTTRKRSKLHVSTQKAKKSRLLVPSEADVVVFETPMVQYKSLGHRRTVGGNGFAASQEAARDGKTSPPTSKADNPRHSSRRAMNLGYVFELNAGTRYIRSPSSVAVAKNTAELPVQCCVDLTRVEDVVMTTDRAELQPPDTQPMEEADSCAMVATVGLTSTVSDRVGDGALQKECEVMDGTKTVHHRAQASRVEPLPTEDAEAMDATEHGTSMVSDRDGLENMRQLPELPLPGVDRIGKRKRKLEGVHRRRSPRFLEAPQGTPEERNSPKRRCRRAGSSRVNRMAGSS